MYHEIPLEINVFNIIISYIVIRAIKNEILLKNHFLVIKFNKILIFINYINIKSNSLKNWHYYYYYFKYINEYFNMTSFNIIK